MTIKLVSDRSSLSGQDAAWAEFAKERAEFESGLPIIDVEKMRRVVAAYDRFVAAICGDGKDPAA